MFQKRTKLQEKKDYFLNLKKFKELEEEKDRLLKTKVQNEKVRLEGLSNKVSFDLKRLPVPLPANFSTFEMLRHTKEKVKGGTSQKKGLGFGVGSRIPLNEKEKWALKVEKYNKNSKKTLDP